MLLSRVLVAALLATALGSVSFFPAFRSLERVFYDLRANLVAGHVPASDQIVIVAITNETLRRMDNALGRFPWPRVIYAPVIDICREAKSIGMDILLTESEPQLGFPDDELLRSVRESGRVVSAVYLEQGHGAEKDPLAGMTPFEIGTNAPGLFNLNHYDMVAPYPGLLHSVARVGHVTPVYDPDGVLRRYALALPYRNRVYPSMALAMYALGEGKKVRMAPDRVLQYGENTWRLQDEGTVGYVQSRKLYRVVEFSSLLERWREESARGGLESLRAEFKGKYVLLGCLATGLPRDRIPTPVESEYPGVMVHATALDGLLNHCRYLLPPLWCSLLFAVGLTVLVAIPATPSPMWKAGLAVSLILFWMLLSGVAAVTLKWMLPITAPLVSLGGYAFLASMYYWVDDRRRRDDMETIEAAKQQFTDMLVHDLKGRMGTMMASLSVLEERLDLDDPSIRRSFLGIQSGGLRMLTQISALLDIRRMEEGAMRIEVEPVSMNQQVGEAVREHQGAASVAGMTLDAAFDPTLDKPLHLDPQVLQRIFANLLWNAILYGSRGGLIQMKVRCRPDGVEVVVVNPGRVIPPEEQKKLFQAFAAIATVEKNFSAVSTGLGLAFCRLATEAMGGTIRLYSPGRGMSEGVEVVLGFPFPERPEDGV
ncbi:MAG: CHASE2 domain-containing protein [Kiritimatiellia bacterium]